ncbi:MAG: hypothetical protein PUE14_03455 [Clostridia bacterium]|nr:hypothetical protein [Clostridia bacterium]
MLKKWTILLLAATLCIFAKAGAEEITIEEVRTQMGENTVAYPQLVGMENEAIQQKINDDIVTSSGVTNHMVALFTLTGQQTLNVSYEAYLNDSIFSTVISARGRLPGVRDGHEYTALTYDLQTGERVTLDQLFTDPQAAVALMEEKAAAALGEEWNGYLEHSEITPLPVDSFTLDEHGITFWYPADQFALGSGYSGACQFWYEELKGLWISDPTPVLTAQEQKAAIEQSVSSGVMPHVPVWIGQSVQEVTDTYRLLRTPDEFPGGRYFLLEHPALRGVLVISDSLQAGYENSVVQGIQLRRGGLHGLLIGTSVREQWQAVLGAPESTVTMTQSMAYDYGLCEGSYDKYHFGKVELRLYADTNGVLYAIQLCN